MRFPMWEEHTIIHMIRAKLAPVNPVMQVLRSNLDRNFFDPVGASFLFVHQA